MTKKVCRICGAPHKAKGLCIKHYWRYRRHGDVYANHRYGTVNNPLGINQYTKKRKEALSNGN